MPKEDYIETIPSGPLGIISLKSCEKLGKKEVGEMPATMKTFQRSHSTAIRRIPISSTLNARVSAVVKQNVLSKVP